MSKLWQNFVGIDISKLFFDVSLIKGDDPKPLLHQKFEQSEAGFDALAVWLESHQMSFDNHTLFCMEDTGIYCGRLATYLHAQKADVWIEAAIKIKRSAGFKRSANDKTDSAMIAQYACRFSDCAALWTPLDKSLAAMKVLLKERERLVKSIMMYQVPVKEYKECGDKQMAERLQEIHKPVVETLESAKEKIESDIWKLIKSDKQMCEQVKRVSSIKGIGFVTAATCLVYTKGFTAFKSGKQFACFCGVVPFVKKQSGTSIDSKPRVSKFANHRIKALLNQCAISAIQHDKELKGYYLRKTEEGKPKRSVINAVKHKLVLRMFAVIRDQRIFVDNYERRCA